MIIRTYETNMLQRKCIADHGTAFEAPLPLTCPLSALVGLRETILGTSQNQQTNIHSYFIQGLTRCVDTLCLNKWVQHYESLQIETEKSRPLPSLQMYSLLEQLLPFRLHNSTRDAQYWVFFSPLSDMPRFYKAFGRDPIPIWGDFSLSKHAIKSNCDCSCSVRSSALSWLAQHANRANTWHQNVCRKIQPNDTGNELLNIVVNDCLQLR